MTDGYPSVKIIENILGIEITVDNAISIEHALFSKLSSQLSQTQKEKEQNSLSFHTIQAKHQNDIVELQAEIKKLEELVKTVGEFIAYEKTCQEDDYLYWDKHWSNLEKAYLKVKKP